MLQFEYCALQRIKDESKKYHWNIVMANNSIENEIY